MFTKTYNKLKNFKNQNNNNIRTNIKNIFNISNLSNKETELYNEYNKKLSLIKTFKPNTFHYLQFNNIKKNYKIDNQRILKFFDFIDPYLYEKILKLFQYFFGFYVIYFSYEIYHNYFITNIHIRKIRSRHLISLL
jgi:hypothetical protein